MNNEFPHAKHSVVFLGINASEASGRGPSLVQLSGRCPYPWVSSPPRFACSECYANEMQTKPRQP